MLVLVLALLDRYLAQGRLDTFWIVGAFALSGLLLVASVATDFLTRRWLNVRQRKSVDKIAAAPLLHG